MDTETGLVSYSKLIDLVIEHHRATNTFPKDTATDGLPEGFQTQFSYTDEDGDTITISSDHELVDAFQQLTSKAIPVLRVLATTTFAIPPLQSAATADCIIDPLTGKLMEAGRGPVLSEHRIKADVHPHHKKDKKYVMSAMESAAGILISTADRLVAAIESIQPIPPATKKELYDSMNSLVATTDSKLQKKQVLNSLQNIAGTLITTVDRLVNTVDVIQPLPPAAKKELMETMDHLVKTTGTKLQKKQVEAALESVAANLVATVDRLVSSVEAVKPVQQEPSAPKNISHSTGENADVSNTIDDSSKLFQDSSADSKMKKRQILLALENLASILIATVDRLVNSVEAIRPLPSASPNGKVGNVERALNTESETMASDNKEESATEPHDKVDVEGDPVNSPVVVEETPQGFDPNFIHGRHTCDNCLTSPIIGIRYHAINRSDYDLCSKCVSKYKGKNISFEPVELDRDRIHQPRWKHRQGKCRFHHIPKPDFSTDNFDAALKEAIRRSLEDVTPTTELSLKIEEEQPTLNPEVTACVVSVNDNPGTTVIGKHEASVVSEGKVCGEEAPEGSVRGTDASCVLIPSSESHGGKSVDQLDWELLNDSHPVDAEVALAAEVLGSKLFLNVDSPSSDDSTLIVNSESVVSHASSSRWEKELTKLSELGFVDANANIEALETLEAANIGVESSDPVTVEQVVDYLIKKSH